MLAQSDQNSANLPQILQILVYDLELCTATKGADITQTGHKNKLKIASHDKMLIDLLTDFFTIKTQHEPFKSDFNTSSSLVQVVGCRVGDEDIISFPAVKHLQLGQSNMEVTHFISRFVEDTVL